MTGSNLEIRTFEVPILGQENSDGKKLMVKVLLHPEYSVMGDCYWGCTWGRSSWVFDQIDICASHVPGRIYPYLLEHERTELSLFVNPECRLALRENIPVPTESNHDMANVRMYLEASKNGDLNFLHFNWLKGEAIKESAESKDYREKLYQYFIN